MRLLKTIIFALIVGLVPAAAGANGHFGFNGVAEIAKKLASEPFRAPQPIPDFLASLSYDDYRDIRFILQSTWKDGAISTNSSTQVCLWPCG
jgi:glucans biosynthesis protein